ncbi:MAG: cohesin domain-containing protein [Saprospiraceae bacterium]
MATVRGCDDECELQRGQDRRADESESEVEVDEMDLQAGQEVTVNFRGINFEQIEGYRLSLKFDNSMLSYVGSESSKPTMNETNFGERYLDRGILTTSWNSNRGEFGQSGIIQVEV